MQFLHAMIRVKDEQKSLDFYCDLIGLKKSRRIELEDCSLQYLKDEITGFEIELTVNKEIPIDGYSVGKAFGHFAFEVESFEEFNKKLKGSTFKYEIEPFYMKEVNTKIAFLLDPDNNMVELIEKN